MTLDQLRVFITVAEVEHVTRAAEQLQLTQSAASAAIAALERRYDIHLFHRVGRRIRLTEAGQTFLMEAKSVVARADAAERVLEELATMRRGSLVVQASQTIATYWLPQRLMQFHARHPAIQIKVLAGNTAQVANSVMDGTTELGFVEGEIEDPILIRETIAYDSLALVVGIGHPWAGRRMVVPGDLRETTWVLRERGSGTRSTFENAMLRLGVDPSELDVAIELPSNESVRMAVEAGVGATVISEFVVAESVRRGTLHKLPFDLPARPFHAIRHRERHQSRAAQEILAMIAVDNVLDNGR